MAATGNEVVLLKQLKAYGDTKLDKPKSAGTNGQMLVYGSEGNQWIDVPDGTAYSADNATLQLTGTQFSVKDGGITGQQIDGSSVDLGSLNNDAGFITDSDLPDKVSQVLDMISISRFPNDAGYVTQSEVQIMTWLPSSIYGGDENTVAVFDELGNLSSSPVTSTELGYLDGVTSAIQTQLDGKAATGHTHAAATTSAPGFMSAADKTKLNGLSNYVLPAATATALGGVKIVSDTDFNSYMGITA